MRTLNKNKQTIYYALYIVSTELRDSNGLRTGEKEITYSTPEALKVNVSAGRGDIDLEIFGINSNYTKTFVTTDLNCPIEEDTIIWFDEDIANPHNYVVVGKAKSLNSITYAIKEVDVSA